MILPIQSMKQLMKFIHVILENRKYKMMSITVKNNLKYREKSVKFTQHIHIQMTSMRFANAKNHRTLLIVSMRATTQLKANEDRETENCFSRVQKREK